MQRAATAALTAMARSTIRCLGIALLAMALLAAPGGAEEPPSDAATLDMLIRSGDARQVAWGAHLAGREGVKEALPALQSFLYPDPDRSGDEWSIPYRHVLDALVRLDATVPGTLLGENLPRLLQHSPMTILLLGREAQKNEESLLGLFDALRKDGRVLRIAAFAIGNFLVAQKTPGFAARVLPWIETELVLTVYDTNQIGLGGGAGGAFPGRGDARRRQPEGYPPYPFYRFMLEGGAHLPLAADGLRPVRYRRDERDGTLIGWGGRSHTFDRADVSREWTASLLGLHVKELGLPERSSQWLRWTRPEAYLRWASAERGTLLRRHKEILDGLRELDALTKDEAKALPARLTVEILDQRKHDKSTLPSLPSLPSQEQV